VDGEDDSLNEDRSTPANSDTNEKSTIKMTAQQITRADGHLPAAQF
jgi:hypothetical protein